MFGVLVTYQEIKAEHGENNSHRILIDHARLINVQVPAGICQPCRMQLKCKGRILARESSVLDVHFSARGRTVMHKSHTEQQPSKLCVLGFVYPVAGSFLNTPHLRKCRLSCHMVLSLHRSRDYIAGAPPYLTCHFYSFCVIALYVMSLTYRFVDTSYLCVSLSFITKSKTVVLPVAPCKEFNRRFDQSRFVVHSFN